MFWLSDDYWGNRSLPGRLCINATAVPPVGRSCFTSFSTAGRFIEFLPQHLNWAGEKGGQGSLQELTRFFTLSLIKNKNKSLFWIRVDILQEEPPLTAPWESERNQDAVTARWVRKRRQFLCGCRRRTRRMKRSQRRRGNKDLFLLFAKSEEKKKWKLVTWMHTPRPLHIPANHTIAVKR